MSAFSRTFSIAAKSDCFKINKLCSPILQGERLSVCAALHRPAPSWQLPPSPLAEYAGSRAEYVILACRFCAHRERHRHIEDAHQR